MYIFEDYRISVNNGKYQLFGAGMISVYNGDKVVVPEDTTSPIVYTLYLT